MALIKSISRKPDGEMSKETGYYSSVSTHLFFASAQSVSMAAGHQDGAIGHVHSAGQSPALRSLLESCPGRRR